MPIFLALFRLIDQAAKNGDRQGPADRHAQASSSRDAKFFGAKISDTFLNTDDIGVRILAAFLVLAMTATTFLTQRQLMSKNMPADALTGPYAQQQKMLLYVLPVVFAVGGIAFPIGVLFYWTTSNLWTMGQQFYVIRNNPAPGTPAAAPRRSATRAKAARKGSRRPRRPRRSAAPPRPRPAGARSSDAAPAAQAAVKSPAQQEEALTPDLP